MKSFQRLVLAALFLIPFTFAARGGSIFPPSGWPTTQYGLANALKAAISPDGKKILAVEGKTAVIMDAATGNPLRVIYRYSTDPGFTFSSGAFMPDGTSVVLGCGGSNLLTDDVVVMYEINTGQILRTFSGQTRLGRFGHTMPVLSLALSLDGSRMVTGSQDKTAKVWNTATGALIHTFSGHTASIYAVAYSPDGSQVATASGDDTARLWNVSTGQVVQTFTGHSNTVYAVAFSPTNGQLLATGSSDNTIRLWSVSDSKPIQTWTGHVNTVGAVTFSPNGGTVLSESSDGTIRLWDRLTGKQLNSFPYNSSGTGSLAFFPDSSRFLAAGGVSHGLTIIDGATGQVLLNKADRDCYGALFSPDGTRILAAQWNEIYLADRKTGARLMRFSGHSDNICALSFSRDGKKFVSGCYDKTARLWDTQTSVSLVTFGDVFTGHTEGVYGVALSSDGTRVLTGGGDNVAKLWNASTGQLIHTLSGHTARVRAVAFSPDGSRLLTGGDDHMVRIWNAQTGAGIAILPNIVTQGIIIALAVSPDGKRLLAADGKKSLIEWTMGTWVQTFSHTYTSAEMTTAMDAAFSSDWSRVIFTDLYRSEIFDRQTGDNRGMIHGSRFQGAAIAAFSPDATQALLAGEGVPLLWDITRNAVPSWRLYH